MNKKVRIGVIGTSEYADFMYLGLLGDYPKVELAAICGQNRERAEQRAAQHQIPFVYTDYKQMIQEANLNGLVVATPEDLHYEMTMMAVSANLHVICDKPLANSAQHALEMFQAAEKARIKHQVTFTYRWIPVFAYLKDLIQEGYIGRCYHAEFRYLMGGGRKIARRNNWRYDQKRSNGNLADMGSHMIDMAIWLLGDIVRASALNGAFVDVPDINQMKITPSNNSAFLLVEIAGGTHGSIFCTRLAHLADRFMQQEIKLYGQDGSLELNVIYEGPNAGAMLLGARNEENRFNLLPLPEKYGKFEPPFDWTEIMTQPGVGCRSWVDAILEDRPAYPTFYDGYKTQQVIEAALVSDQTGQWVRIS